MTKHHTTESVERLAQRCNENHRLRASIVFPLNDECATTLMDLCAERDGAMQTLGEFLALLPVSEIVGAGATIGELAEALKAKLAERDALRARLDEASPALRALANGGDSDE